MQIEQTSAQELEWVQANTSSRDYQLTSSGSQLGSLRFEKRCGSLATGEWGGRQWTFKRTGFLSPRVTVREAGSEADLAVFTPGWSGKGSVAFATGRRYHLGPTNFWHTEWAFAAEDTSAVVVLTGPHGLFKHGGHARVPAGAGLAETPVLLLLIWYVRVLMNEDAAAGAVIVACS